MSVYSTLCRYIQLFALFPPKVQMFNNNVLPILVDFQGFLKFLDILVQMYLRYYNQIFQHFIVTIIYNMNCIVYF